MNRKAFKTCAATLAAGLGLLGGALPAMGQTPPGQAPPTTTTVTFPGDWPNLGAYTNRQGRNGNPFAYSAGLTQLRYLLPNTQAFRAPIVLDNTDLRANELSRFGGTTTAIGPTTIRRTAPSSSTPPLRSTPPTSSRATSRPCRAPPPGPRLRRTRRLPATATSPPVPSPSRPDFEATSEPPTRSLGSPSTRAPAHRRTTTPLSSPLPRDRPTPRSPIRPLPRA